MTANLFETRGELTGGMSGPDNLSTIDRLRARDGDHCWLCGLPIDFKAEPNSAKAWSIEHLLSSCHGGSDRLENLALCHPPCNRSLANRPVVRKVKMRERQRRKVWRSTIGGQFAKALRPNMKLSNKKADPGSSPG